MITLSTLIGACLITGLLTRFAGWAGLVGSILGHWLTYTWVLPWINS